VTTLLLLSVFGTVLALQFFLMAGALRIVAPRLSTADNSFRRCLMTAVALFFVAIPAAVAEKAMGGLPLLIIGLISIGLNGFVISRLLRMPVGKALLACLAMLVVIVPFAVVALLIVRPFILEAFTPGGNSMAPTLLGEHWTGTCPHCGGPTYCSPQPDDRSAPDEAWMICDRELRAYKVQGVSTRILPSDKFLINKLIKPARWDIVVYRFPTEPSTVYVGRLVGMPGETLVIEDGSVWINGDRLVPPEEYAGLFYADKLDDFASLKAWGAPDSPAELGPDEYFILGDFTNASRDSRFWVESIDGRPPYALPAANIVGVVTHIYWPLDRWRVFR
jgi:signal peptidase I